MNYIAKITLVRNNGTEKNTYFAGKEHYTFSKLNYSNILCKSWNNLYIAKKAIKSNIIGADHFWDSKEVEILTYEKTKNEEGKSSYHLISKELVYKVTKLEKEAGYDFNFEVNTLENFR